MENRVYFLNEVHDDLISKVGDIINISYGDVNKIAVEIHQMLLSGYLQDEVDHEDS